MRNAIALTAILLLAAAACAGEGTLAELMAERAEVLVEAAVARLAASEAERKDATDRWEAAVATDEERLEAEAAAADARTALARARLDLAEVRHTGEPPRDDVAAPRVGERDLVAERLRLDLEAARRRAEDLTRSLDRATALARAGRASTREVADLRFERDVEAGLAKALEDRLAVREAFLAGSLDAAEAGLRAARVEATLARDVARRRLVEAERALEEARAGLWSGRASTGEARAAEREHAEAATELRLAEIDLRIVEAGGAAR